MRYVSDKKVKSNSVSRILTCSLLLCDFGWFVSLPVLFLFLPPIYLDCSLFWLLTTS